MRKGLLQIFEESLSRCVADIANAVGRGDQTELRRVAHLLKGSSATLGAVRLKLICERLEHTGRGEDQAIGQDQLEELQAIGTEARAALLERLA